IGNMPDPQLAICRIDNGHIVNTTIGILPDLSVFIVVIVRYHRPKLDLKQWSATTAQQRQQPNSGNDDGGSFDGGARVTDLGRG
ncbi:hypothetical protein Dimus_017872, partial [Dionaea muscipula]